MLPLSDMLLGGVLKQIFGLKIWAFGVQNQLITKI
jgi:hypothetical protein